MTTGVLARTNTIKAIVQDGYGSADVLHLREIERPVLLDGRVLVRVRAASVNALDWHTVHGGRAMRTVTFVLRQPIFHPGRGPCRACGGDRQERDAVQAR